MRSPANNRHRTLGIESPRRRDETACKVRAEGTDCHTVTRDRLTRRAMRAAFAVSIGVARTTAADAAAAAKTSKNDRSKLSGAWLSRRSSGPRSNAVWAHDRNTARFAWLMTAPFGWPVDPDVCRTAAAPCGDGLAGMRTFWLCPFAAIRSLTAMTLISRLRSSCSTSVVGGVAASTNWIWQFSSMYITVSYTHLTLPTIYS